MQSGDRLCKPATHYAVKRPVLRICDPLCSLVTGYVNLRPVMQSSDRLCKPATHYAAKRPVLRICSSLCSLVTGNVNLRLTMQPSAPLSNCLSALNYTTPQGWGQVFWYYSYRSHFTHRFLRDNHHNHSFNEKHVFLVIFYKVKIKNQNYL